MSITTVPSVVTGQTYSAANYNTQVRDNINGLWVCTTEGDMIYATGASAAARLARPASLGILQCNSTGVPSYVTGGTGGQVLRKNAANTGFEWSAALPHCVVSHNADFSYASGYIAWNTDTLDTGGWHNTSSNNSRITVPETGIYIAGAVVSFYEGSGGAAGPRIIALGKNGTDLMAFRYTGYTDGIPRSLLIPHMPISLAANDYLEVGANLGGTRTVVSAESRFWVMRIG